MYTTKPYKSKDHDESVGDSKSEDPTIVYPEGLHARDKKLPPRSNRTGYIYIPFISPDMIEMAVGINLRRHIQGKPLYPVITNGEYALDPIKMEARFQSADAEEKINNAVDIYAEPRLQNKHDMAADTMKLYAQKLAVLKRTTYLSNIDNGNSKLSTLVAGKDKLYILGHGLAGDDGISGDIGGKKTLTSKQIVDLLIDDGLPKDFDDIRFNACFGADTINISSFDPVLLDESSGSNRTNWFTKKLYGVPMAKKVSQQLSERGYEGIVSAYHGEGDIYSLDGFHTRTIKNKNNGDIKIRGSRVRRTFKSV